MDSVLSRAKSEIDATDHALFVQRYGGLVNERIWATGGVEVDEALFAERYSKRVRQLIDEAAGDRQHAITLLVDAADREPL